ncbi:pyrrolo-quinoline quinone [Haematobacter missouriensis]|uniref:Pyrrolo-quinoline quinone n=1 Tax=Haematobacter missouriensis TaxID=366616 RepID=A0A212AUI7_9RHOB|nr:PQQ-binding-like beta-propeller repeat protein [Haematobacter missouriensis]KFI33477.1 pyrrolo-quinoline quinone [Haematobacter missouriensis]OWJ79565.1 pyrrolo-quinoline quinone [Haematobacter missouriensis]OWJ85152.1 pyrrolo-quinoline quinone [Haematobacter missouriensis]
MSFFSKPLLAATTALVALSGAAFAQNVRENYKPVTEEMLANPPEGEWLMWRGDRFNSGYSKLKQINKETVAKLQLAWAWPMAEAGIQETVPLIHDGVMFLQTNNNIVEALDAKTGDLIWTYRHVLAEIPASWSYQANQARRQKNSIALAGDKVVLTTADAKIVVLNAADGKVVWEKQVLDYQKGYSYTVGPIIVKDKIISAISGCSIAGTAGGCFIMAHNLNTGEELWRFNTIDDPDNPKQQESWGPVPAENRWGGTPWATGSYDERTNTTFWGIGMPGPYSELVRGSGDGSVLYTNSTLALDADTGKLKWYFQHLPRDNWDLDSPFERILVDQEADGKTSHMLISVPGKNGIAFALDRDTGKYLWSKETVKQNAVSKIDADGTVHINTDLVSSAIGESKLVCTSVSGGKLWMAGAYSPDTKAFFVPLTEACNTVTPTQSEFTAGNAVGSVKFGPRVLPEGITEAGLLQALDINPKQGESKWQARERPSMTSSVLATAGGLVFGGDAARYISAWDQETGKVLWRQRLNAPIGGSPVTYEIDGEQYLVVPTGYSNAASSISSAFPETPLPTGSGNSIFVYKLPKASN